MSTNHIRNFCIIAHIDHGKSTLADRLLEMTGTVEKRAMKEQLLDSMDLEREKGITIKLQPVRLDYTQDDVEYQLNLIDTPGHVDFSYEVSRSLQAAEGAVLLVDATQGIQAQTLSNVYLAMEAELEIIPVLNKIDLPAADVERVSTEVIKLLGCKKEDIFHISAKTGEGVDAVLERVISDIPPPADTAGNAKALVFDSEYDEYRGVILYVRVFEGEIPSRSEIKLLATSAEGQALEVGSLEPAMSKDSALRTGEIGYIVTNFKTVHEARVGDTVTLLSSPAEEPLPGYKESKPFVYAGVFPESNDAHQVLKDALEKLALNDSSLKYEPENSDVLGFGFRVGFLGLLHMDIIKERLEREYGLSLIVTNPSTEYQVSMLDGSDISITSASDLPEVQKILEVREPWIKGEIVCPHAYVGAVIQLVVGTRGFQSNIDYSEDQLALISFEAPLANVLTHFYDQLKSITSGYGSFNYELADYRADDLVRLDFLVAGERVESGIAGVEREEPDKTVANARCQQCS